MNYVKEYIEKIKKGEILASKKVQKWYINHIESIIDDQDQVYRFNEELGEIFIEFTENFCKQYKPKVKPLKLELFQKAKYQAIFGIVERKTGKRRFNEIFDIRARKNGKTTESAALSLFLTKFQPGAEVYAAATTFNQAKRLWDDAREMIKQSKILSNHYSSKVFPTPTISVRNQPHYFKVLSSNVSTHDGLNPSGAVIDEVHELSRAIYDIIRQGTSAREDWLISMISTAGFVRNALFDDLYEYAEKVIDGIIEAPSFFPLIYELDAPDEIFKEECWIKANPGLGPIKLIDQLRENVEQMKGQPNFGPTVRTKDFNLRGVDRVSWLPFEDIENTEYYSDDDLKKFNNTIVLGAFDLSRTTDMTAAGTLLFDPAKKKIIAVIMYWITENFLNDQKRPNQAGNYIPWDAWIERGLVRISGTNAIDYHDVANWFIANHHKYGWIYQYINYDSWSANYLVEELVSLGFPKDYCLIPTVQGFKTLSVPMQTLETDLKGKILCYQNNPVTKWCFTNVEVVKDRNGNLMPKKANDQRHRKIDGMAVILNAYVSLCDKRDYYLNK